ncbi:hypothetical protein J6590_076246 [Homalodisca vitripennis]|nr:hypothetical protein J6590_076246 [Homalodisca vitripennis]
MLVRKAGDRVSTQQVAQQTEDLLSVLLRMLETGGFMNIGVDVFKGNGKVPSVRQLFALIYQAAM